MFRFLWLAAALAACSGTPKATNDPGPGEPKPAGAEPAAVPAPIGASSTHITGVPNGWWMKPAVHCPRGSQFEGAFPAKSNDPVDWVAECYNDKQGVRVGPFTSWWPNGNKQEEGKFANDNAHGMWAEWDETGTLTAAKRYQNGELVEAVRYQDGAPAKREN